MYQVVWHPESGPFQEVGAGKIDGFDLNGVQPNNLYTDITIS